MRYPHPSLIGKPVTLPHTLSAFDPPSYWLHVGALARLLRNVIIRSYIKVGEGIRARAPSKTHRSDLFINHFAFRWDLKVYFHEKFATKSKKKVIFSIVNYLLYQCLDLKISIHQYQFQYQYI